MNQKMTKVTLKNEHDPDTLRNPLLRAVHPLAASHASRSMNIVHVPAWIDTMLNRVAMKQAFLEIIKPDS
jgi:hypothetical protein